MYLCKIPCFSNRISGKGGIPDQNAPTRRLSQRCAAFWVPDQNNALRFSGFQPEARLRATLGQDAPHGRGVSDPSPCAPPRQAGKPGPIGHRVVGFCGTARVEWAGPVWPKKQVGAGSDMSVVSTLLEVGRIPGEFIRGVEPPLMCAFYLAFCTSKKQAVRPDGTGHLGAACGTLNIGAKKAAAYTYYIMWRASISSTSEAMASQPLERRS